MAISPDGRFVAAGSLDKSVRIWDTQTGVLVERTEGDQGHKDSVYSVAFSPSGATLVSGSLDKTIRMWKLNNAGFGRGGLGASGGPHPKSGECVRTFEGHKDFVLSVALTPDDAWVMSGSKDRGVQFWDPHTGHAQLMLQGHKNSGKFAFFLLLGVFFQTEGGWRTCEIEKQTQEGKGGKFKNKTEFYADFLSFAVISVAPSPMGGLFATGSGDMKARIWRYSIYNGP